MTLDGIARMMKLARVERSKTVRVVHPNPSFTIHVPAAWFLTISAVVARVKMPHERCDVVILQSRDVAPGAHLFVRVEGESQSPTIEFDRHQRARTVRARNRGVVIDCHTVAL